MMPGRRQRVVDGRGDADIQIGLINDLARKRRAIVGLDGRTLREDGDGSAACDVGLRAPERRKLGRTRQRQVHPQRRMAHAQPFDSVGKPLRQVFAPDKFEEGALGVGVGKHALGARLLAAFKPHADGAATLQDDAINGRLGAILHAMGAAGRSHRLGNRPHAAAGMTPRATLALELAKRVMEVGDR